jgi:hypothetical protein
MRKFAEADYKIAPLTHAYWGPDYDQVNHLPIAALAEACVPLRHQASGFRLVDCRAIGLMLGS